MTLPQISVIIVAKDISQNLKECIAHCLKNTYHKFEIIVILDNKTTLSFPKTKIYCVGKTGPAKKRDYGSKKSKSDIVVFIDDDAYPSKRWLENIVNDFKKENVAAVGGPGVTPPDSNWREDASGWVSASPAGSGFYIDRFLPGHKKYIDDWPSMNLAVRRADFSEIGGFDSNFYPGEDTKLCLDLVHKLKKKILYDPNALVFHHRRLLWIPHLIQHGNYGLHRGYFARVLPRTSARISYFLPSFLVVLIFINFFIYSTMILKLNTSHHLLNILISMCSSLLFLYFIILILNALWIYLKSKKIKMSIISIPAIILTHIWYGIKFIQGLLFVRKLYS
jgi:cellulose synthase/poly-beta-1,6-N-acetylglucosamine synthase-like glycosyltransferase